VAAMASREREKASVLGERERGKMNMKRVIWALILFILFYFILFGLVTLVC
jgi:hypothetical protein